MKITLSTGDEKTISRRKIKMEWIPLDELPSHILQYCKRHELTREEFGARVGASRQSVNDWVSKRFYPKITVYEKILRLLQESDTE